MRRYTKASMLRSRDTTAVPIGTDNERRSPVQTATTIHNAGDAVLVSFTNALSILLGFIPNLIGALVVLLIGWIIAGIVAKLLVRVLQTVGFEKAVEHAGVGGFLKRAGTTMNASQVLGLLVKWFIRSDLRTGSGQRTGYAADHHRDQ